MNSRRVSARSSGDEGHTDLLGGHRLAKSDAVFDAMGALDELGAALGLLRAATEIRENADWIESIQRDLLEIGSELATEQARLAPDAVRRLEVSMALKKSPKMAVEIPHPVGYQKGHKDGRTKSPGSWPRDFPTPTGSGHGRRSPPFKGWGLASTLKPSACWRSFRR